MDINECYDTLGLTSDASFEQVHKRFIELSKKYHPDSKFNVSDADKIYYQERFKEINEAYQTIKNSFGGTTIPVSESKSRNLSNNDIAKTYYARGLNFLKEGDINNALDCFLNAYRKDETNPRYLRNVVKCLMEKPRRLHEAKEYCMKLIKLEDYNGENFFLLGKIYYKAELKSAALNYLKKAKTLNYVNSELDALIEELDEKQGFARKVFSIFGKNKD
ncbi:J domain-containing protein [Deferribacteraceae bacterium V6Fe1]|nr:J domain-containing protein [Deferribacteraceae bacterium V6Fe1]